MQKSTKIFLGTLGVLAAIDLSDICAKGQAISACRPFMDKDPYKMLIDAQTHKLPKIRAKMIVGVGKIFDKFDEISKSERA